MIIFVGKETAGADKVSRVQKGSEKGRAAYDKACLTENRGPQN